MSTFTTRRVTSVGRRAVGTRPWYVAGADWISSHRCPRVIDIARSTRLAKTHQHTQLMKPTSQSN